MANFRSRTYRGKGPEIVWVGEGSEVCGLGFESTKYHFLKTGELDVLTLGLRTGVFRPLVNAQGEPVGVGEPLGREGEWREISLQDQKGLGELQKRWQEYFDARVGIRSMGPHDTEWTPSGFHARRDLETVLPKSMVEILGALSVHLEIVREFSPAESEKEWRALREITPQLKAQDFPASPMVQVRLTHALSEPFPFKTDLAACLPAGWHQSEPGQLGLSRKEFLSLNPALVMAHEVVYRALLHSCLHPRQRNLWEIFSPEKVGLYLGSGIGPHGEHQQMIVDTLSGDACGAKSLANCIANIANGYLSARLGVKGKISTHVGACETCLGSIADAYWDLKSERFHGAIAGGFEDAVTASSFNGFCSNLAFTTNEKLLHNLQEMVKEGVFSQDSEVAHTVHERLEQVKSCEEALLDLEKRWKAGTCNSYLYQKERRRLREEKRSALMQLPKSVARLASMPFAKYRSGFVMGIGGGAGFFTTLDIALEQGLPIRALIAGVGEMVPDSGEDGTSIAALGDGVGDAYARAFQETCGNYEGTRIEDIGVWFAHGTSTPQNGWGERREIERVHRRWDRAADRPILITGDKAEVGHRVGGNFPSLVGYIFAQNEVLPVGNYLQAGHEPVGRKGFGAALDELFPSSRVVGKAGVGGGGPVAYDGLYVAVNGAGFGRINTVLIFRRFDLSQVEVGAAGKREILARYPQQLAKNLQERSGLSQKILFSSVPLI